MIFQLQWLVRYSCQHTSLPVRFMYDDYEHSAWKN